MSKNDRTCAQHGHALVWEVGGPRMPTIFGRWVCRTCHLALMAALTESSGSGKARPGGEAVETDDTTCLLDGDGDWWVFKNRFWYCIGGGAEIDHGPEAMVGATAFIGPDSWVDIERIYRVVS